MCTDHLFVGPITFPRGSGLGKADRPTSQLHAPHVVHRIRATLVVYIAVAMPYIYFQGILCRHVPFQLQPSNVSRRCPCSAGCYGQTRPW